jgi:hypothetical protein
MQRKAIGEKHFLIMLCFLSVNTMLFAQHFRTKKTAEGIEITENGKKVLFYQVQPKSVDGKYERAGYVHPLYSLNENMLTDDSPVDHPYHRGIFWAWHQVILNDKSIADGWMSEHISWKPTGVKTKKERNKVILHSQLIWNAELSPDQLTPIVKEETRITVFKATPQYRILDFDINLFALVDHLEIGGSDDPKGYGGFCLRLKLPADLSFISENKKVIPEETAVFAGPWMDFTGSFAGEHAPKSGVTVFGYSPAVDGRYPWILRSKTSMQNIPYPGRAPIELSRQGLHLSYRVIVHNGEMNNEAIEKLYKEYYRL